MSQRDVADALMSLTYSEMMGVATALRDIAVSHMEDTGIGFNIVDQGNWADLLECWAESVLEEATEKQRG